MALLQAERHAPRSPTEQASVVAPESVCPCQNSGGLHLATDTDWWDRRWVVMGPIRCCFEAGEDVVQAGGGRKERDGLDGGSAPFLQAAPTRPPAPVTLK